MSFAIEIISGVKYMEVYVGRVTKEEYCTVPMIHTGKRLTLARWDEETGRGEKVAGGEAINTLLNHRVLRKICSKNISLLIASY